MHIVLATLVCGGIFVIVLCWKRLSLFREREMLVSLWWFHLYPACPILWIPKCARMFVAIFWATSSDRLLASRVGGRHGRSLFCIRGQTVSTDPRKSEREVEQRGTILFASPSRVDDGTVPDRRGIDAYDTARVTSNHNRS
jgi:hypothetical protein